MMGFALGYERSWQETVKSGSIRVATLLSV
jgi:hypothetical protein